jgi:aldose 1-epimerase
MKIEPFTLGIPGEIELTFLNYGGIIQSLRVPDRSGVFTDVVLGFDDPEDYQRSSHPYFGALIGRYANRIRDGRFPLGKRTFKLARNRPPNALHGGERGFDKRFWKVRPRGDGFTAGLTLVSPDGDEGYPGELRVEVTYQLTKGRELVIDYLARALAPTILNLTNHSYFNLSGDRSPILEHELWLNAARFTEVDGNLTPTGQLLPATGAMDFQTQKKIGRDIAATPAGYDHNFVLNEAPLFDPKARLFCRDTGITLEVFTTEPGIQVYSGNFLDGTLAGKGGNRYAKYQGICLETQHFPDSPNHTAFPSTVLLPGETFNSKTIYKFSAAP